MPGPGESGEILGNIEDTLKELLGGDLEKTLAEATGKSSAPPPTARPAAAPPGTRPAGAPSPAASSPGASSLLTDSGIAAAAAVSESSIEDLLRETMSSSSSPAPAGAGAAAPPSPPGSAWAAASPSGGGGDSQQIGRTLGDSLPEPKRESLKGLLKVRLPLRVQLARKTLPLKDVLALTEGAIIEFGKPIDSPLDLLVSDHKIATGEAIKVGDKFGLKVRSIADVRDTIRRLGPA